MNTNCLPEEGLVSYLRFLLEKVEWEDNEMRWMLQYLNESDGRCLSDLIFQSFSNPAIAVTATDDFRQTAVWNRLNKLLF